MSDWPRDTPLQVDFDVVRRVISRPSNIGVRVGKPGFDQWPYPLLTQFTESACQVGESEHRGFANHWRRVRRQSRQERLGPNRVLVV